MSTTAGARPSWPNASGSNDRPSPPGACGTTPEPPDLTPRWTRPSDLIRAGSLKSPDDGQPSSLAGALNLLVDSPGVKVLGDGEWQVCRHGPGRRRQWRKVHLAFDETIGDTQGVEFTSGQ